MPDGGKITMIPAGIVARASNSVRTLISGVTQSWFGPGQPLPPMAPPDVKGRQWDFPYGVNLQYNPRVSEAISFDELRALADSLPLLRLAIETRKDQVQGIAWNVRKRIPAGQRRKRQEESDPRIQALTDFLQFPDREHDFSTWMRMLIEEMLVIDAACVYPRTTLGGDPYALEIVDGATIKRLIDEKGRVPDPPNPAYQQVLHGIPAADFALDELIYSPRNVRVNKFYGFSPVEQIVLTVNIALRREMSTLEYYKAGSVPDAIVALPKEWTIDQVSEFQKYWDALLSGQLAERRRMRFVPGGNDFKLQETKQPPLKDQYDEWLARLICYALSVSVSPLVSQVNRATGETLQMVSNEEGLKPTLIFTQNLMNRILRYIGFADLEFAWEIEAKEDQASRAEADQIDVDTGIRSIDEVREDRGLEPIGVGHTVKTASGPVPLIEAVNAAKEDILNPPAPPPQLAQPPGKNAETDPKNAETDPKNAETDPKKGQSDEEVGKVAGAPFAKAARRRTVTLRYTRPVTRRTERALEAVVAAGLRDLRDDVVRQVRASLRKADESFEEMARRIAEELDLSGLSAMVDATQEQLEEVMRDGSARMLARIGVTDRSELVDQVRTESVSWARERAAQMVGMRYDSDGNLVPAKRAEYRIDETTRDMIREKIASGLEENVGLDGIIDDLESSFAFSEERAELIARTEVRRANNESELISARASRDELGLGLRKYWMTAEDEGVCEICEANGDQGAIDLDDAFESGDDTPPAHPRCKCTLAYEVRED